MYRHLLIIGLSIFLLASKAVADQKIISTISDFGQIDSSDQEYTQSDDGELNQDHSMEPDTGSKTTTTLPKNLSDHSSVLIDHCIVIAGGLDDAGYSQNVYINPIINNNLTLWANGPVLPEGIKGHQLVKSGSKIYCLGGRVSTGVTTTVYYSAFDYSSNTMTNWQSIGSMPVALENYQAVAHKGKIYIIGGEGSGVSNTIYYADINSNNSLSPWQTATSLPAGLTDLAAAIYGNRLFILGGNNGSTDTNKLYSYLINDNGTLGTVIDEGDYPSNISRHYLLSTSSGLMSIGGYDSTYLSYQSSLRTTDLQNSTGSPTNWTVFTISSLADRTAHIYNAKIFILGGRNASSPTNEVELIPLNIFTPWKLSDTFFETCKNAEIVNGDIYDFIYLAGGELPGSIYTNKIYRSKFNTSGNGNIGWSIGGYLPVTQYAHAMTSYNNRIYTIGGSIPGAGGNTDAVYYSNQIADGDGSVTSWTYTSKFPHTTAGHRSVAYNDTLYVFEGASVYYNTIFPDGSIGAIWQQTSGLPSSIESPFRSHPIVYNNRMYVITRDTTLHLFFSNIQANGLLDPWQETTAPPNTFATVFAMDLDNEKVVITGSEAAWADINTDGTIGNWNIMDTTSGYTVNSYFSIQNDYINIYSSEASSYYSTITSYRSNYHLPFSFYPVYKNINSISWDMNYASDDRTLQYRIYDNGWGNWTDIDSSQNSITINQQAQEIQFNVSINTYRQKNGNISSITLDYDDQVITPTATPSVTATPASTSTPLITPDGFDGKIISKKTTYAFPNPSYGPVTKFNIYTKEPSKLIFKIYTPQNKFVHSQTVEYTTVGYNLIKWNNANMANGVYLCLVEAEGHNTGTKERVLKRFAIIK